MLIVGHAESPWISRLRTLADYGRFLVLGLALGAVVDVIVRVCC
jgi:hypothetical protein